MPSYGPNRTSGEKALEDFHLLVDDLPVDEGQTVHVMPGVNVSAEDVTVDGKLRVDGTLYVFGNMSGTGTVNGSGKVKLVN